MKSFEETLSSFSRDDLPPEWREEMVSATLDSLATGLKKRDRTQKATTCFLAIMAACWVMAGFLFLDTPEGPSADRLAETYGIPEEQLPILIARSFPLSASSESPN